MRVTSSQRFGCAAVSPSAAGAEHQGVPSGELLRLAMLLLLRDQDSHGYELLKRLAELDLEAPATTGALYRSLRTMADEGLVTPYWSTPDRGPARRVYAITEEGQQHLEQWMPALARLGQTLRGMLNRYRRAG